MNLMEQIKDSVEKKEALFALSLSATPEEILNADVDELTFIINKRPLYTSDGKPCRCYCIDCGRKGVPLSECHLNIRNTLLKTIEREE